MKFIYLLVCLLRVLLIASPGYIHPDEYFQGPEVFSPVGGNRTWEWQPEHALRTPVVPWVFFSCWIPSVWFSSRLVPLALSFVIDAFVWRASNKSWTRLLLYATSWPALLLQSRTFTNGLEAVAVASMSLLRHWPICVGIVGAAASFSRFTFPAFALAHVRLPPLGKTVAAAVGMATVLVVVDSIFYGRFVVTPLQAFVYNSQTENVAQHGLHPRYLHVLVNLPLLLGPVLLFRLRFSSSMAWLLPLVVLSVSPHQEPRFLLPLVAPAVVAGVSFPVVSRAQWAMHLTFHSAAVGFFGFLHQAGVVPSVRAMAAATRTNAAAVVVYWKTYPPPRHLAGSIEIIDMQGCDFSKAADAIAGGGVLIAPAHLVPTASSGLIRGQCWGLHISTENWTPLWENWQLCEWVSGH